VGAGFEVFKAASKQAQIVVKPGTDTLAYEFGPYRLEPDTRRLLRGDDPVSLTPKAFDILLALIERHDRVVDKAELMKLVWPDSFVEEANLSQTIFVLRKTLGDGPDGRPYIDTVPRRGYRFGAEVRGEGARAGAAIDRESTPDARAPWLRGAAIAVAVLAITTLLAVVALSMFGQGDSSGGDLLAGKTLVVVLPFENRTNDRADDWLASAFSDSLTSGLQRVDTLIPVSRDRIVELYRQQGIHDAAPADADVLRRVAQTLGVRYFVHGSYQRSADDITVIARLVAVDDGTIEAQETVTDAYRNLLQLEDNLAGRLATKLQARPRSSTSDETKSLEAYQATIEGRTLYAQSRFTEALPPLTRATTLDPRYAQAWALLSKTHARLATIAVISSGSAGQLHRDALSHANRAVELAPELYDAHVALALAYRGLGDFERWRAGAQKAIELNPSIGEAYALLADSYFAGNAFGCQRDRDARRAEENYRTAIRLDRRLSAAYSNLSYHFSWLGREDEALRIADEAVRVMSADANSKRARALALVRLRRVDEAERELQRMVDAGAAMSGQDHLTLGAIALARGNADLAAREFRTTLSRLPTSAFQLAIGRTYLENRMLEEGLTHLDEAVAIEPSCAAFVAASPAFAPYRDAPQFRARLDAWKRPGT
jgi:DNA-binding winged helix-turn-helix (wHTH) protein/tetratricopeptide (TPR) repeat protein